MSMFKSTASSGGRALPDLRGLRSATSQSGRPLDAGRNSKTRYHRRYRRQRTSTWQRLVRPAPKSTPKNARSVTGPKGQGGPQDRLTGGIGTLASAKPVKTPVSLLAQRHHDLRLRAARHAHATLPSRSRTTKSTRSTAYFFRSTPSSPRTPSSTPNPCRKSKCPTATAS